MTDLTDATKDQLIAELLNRTTFAGIIVYYTEDVKNGNLEKHEIKLVKSPPLSQLGVELLLATGTELSQGMFG